MLALLYASAVLAGFLLGRGYERTHAVWVNLTYNIESTNSSVDWTNVPIVRVRTAATNSVASNIAVAYWSLPEPPAPELPNGLEDWAADTNHQLGVWVAKSARIVRTKDGKYLPQFRDCDDTNAVWCGMFVGDVSFDSLAAAQAQIRRAFEIKKEVTDAMADALRGLGDSIRHTTNQ